MASCDVITKKIYDCKKNSWPWWHEKGHITFYNSGLGTKVGANKEYALLFFMMAVMLRFISSYWVFTIPVLLSGLCYICYYFYEEYWCNRFADRHYKG